MLVLISLKDRRLHIRIKENRFWNFFLRVPYFYDENASLDFYCEDPNEIEKWLKQRYSYVCRRQGTIIAIRSECHSNVWSVEILDEELLTHPDHYIREHTAERLLEEQC